MDDEMKKLDTLREKLIKAKEVLSHKDVEISDGELVKYHKNGQWSMSKEDEPYWSTKSKFKQQKKNRQMDRKVNTKNIDVNKPKYDKPVNTTAAAKPSTETKYVNIPGSGRGEEKDMSKFGGSLQGNYKMISH